MVWTVNVPDELPDGIVTVTGAEASALSELRLMTNPPSGAERISVIVPVDGLPPTTLDGAKERLPRIGIWTVKEAVRVVAP